ncbi:hypothetical protein [Phenylobacterium sp.]|uniref:hypothetical protein n=1 Tax=Phenylobacterium sp. TaxID=1871053 RepID=UPI002C7CCDC5|nr:hypothetical protein [Phenylobacterium sp.]HVI31036.1 hypothetical protein [Phenylobacterium sp.]
MKKHFAAALAVIAISGAAAPATAQIGALKARVPGLGGGAAAAPGDIDSFLATTQQAEQLTRVSAISLLEAVSSKEEATRLRDLLKAAEAKSDPKEREAALRQVTADAAAQLAAVDFSAKSKELEAKATEAERRKIGVAVYNLALAILMDKQAVDQGRGLLQSAGANPMAMASGGGKLLKVKDAAGAISGQMGNLARISAGLPKLMSVGKLAALPTSTTDAPRAIAD